MNKIFLFTLALSLLFLKTSVVSAQSLYTVSSTGVVSQNVLGESFDVKSAATRIINKAADAALDGVKEIVVEEVEKRAHVKLIFLDGTSAEPLDDSVKNLVKIETEDKYKSIQISKTQNGFSIQSEGIEVVSPFNISVTAQNQSVWLKSESTNEEMKILPSDAIKLLVTKNLLSNVPSVGEMEIKKIENGELVYSLWGEKTLNLFGVSKVKIPVETNVSVARGDVSFPSEPSWLSVLSIIFG